VCSPRATVSSRGRRAPASTPTLTGTELKKFAPLDAACRRLLERSAERLHMSARAFHRVIRVSRTIADLAGADAIALDHLAEALQYRFVEKAP